MSEEDNYLKESVIKCVDYAMKQDDEAKRRIFTGLFKYCDRLVNEDILVTCLNDEQKREWLHNELIDNYKSRIDKAIGYIENECLDDTYNYCHDLCGNDIFELLDILKGKDE